MKNLNSLFFIFLISFISVSCSNDDDNNDDLFNSDNKLAFEGIGYTLESGIVINNGIENNDETYNFDLKLYSTEIDFSSGNPSNPNENIFSTIQFELISDDSENIAIGNYEFSNNNDAFTFSNISGIIIDYDYAEEEGEIMNTISGEIKVLENNPYKIAFEGVVLKKIEDDNITNYVEREFFGYYEGDLEYYDNSLP